ncbi:MAG: hypothetical protein MJ103_08675 [Saccharofermentans sp.]|nr:hypothetical protein [Saccharofermentans sp.]
MNRSKAVSLLLISSFMLSSTSCTMGEKKKVLEVVDNYAQAIMDADLGDIDDFLKSDDEYEEIVCSYVKKYEDREDYSDIFECILNNMSYEINKDSIVASKESKKALVNITFTMIDYMSVYEDLDEDADLDDFLDELEDNTDNVIHIRQKIELNLVKDEWKIVDTDYENLLEVYEFYEDICKNTITGLNGYTMTPDEFENYLDEFGINEDDIYSDLNEYDYSAFTYTEETVIIYMIMANESELNSTVTSLWDEMEAGNGSFSDLTIDSDSYFGIDSAYFCGRDRNDNISVIFYRSGNSLLILNSMHDDTELLAFLDLIGYPHP